MSRTTEDNLERELEEVVPKNTFKDIRRHPLVYIGGLVIVIALIVLLSIGYALANKSLKSERNMVASLNNNLQKSANELTALQDTLSKTEEGKKQVEAAKAQVEGENKKLDERATTAERTVVDVKADLKDAEKQLSSKQAELASATSDLANKSAELDQKKGELSNKQGELDRASNDLKNKQVEIDKANRGIALFDQAKSLFDTFDTNSRSLVNSIISWQADFDNGNYTTGDYWSGVMNSSVENAVKARGDITTLFNKIKSGNY